MKHTYYCPIFIGIVSMMLQIHSNQTIIVHSDNNMAARHISNNNNNLTAVCPGQPG